MRAATHAGLTLGGLHVGLGVQLQTAESDSKSKSKVVAPDLKALETRREYRAAIVGLGQHLEVLLETATAAGETTEAQFWQAALDRLKRT